MKIHTTYSAKINKSDRCFTDTAQLYRSAVGFFIDVLLKESHILDEHTSQKSRVNAVETITVPTASHPDVTYDFSRDFYKFPCYLRRAAIAEAIGKVSSYRSNLANWEALPDEEKARCRKPGLPVPGFVYPVLYKDNMYKQTGLYTFKVKVWIHNTWDWVTVRLRKSDMDYISRRCGSRTKMSPTLRKRGKNWYLDFPFEEDVQLTDTGIFERTIISVDLGINNAATVTAMTSDGTVIGRHFLKLPEENDSLMHAVNRIKKAQQHGARKMPRLWAKANGINDDIAAKTANYIIDIAILYNADVIVFEHLDVQGKKRGSKKQRLHLWKSQYVQAMVTDKAHRCSMRVSRVNAWGTSRLAYDGSGAVLRGDKSEKTGGNYSLCEFTTGKVYHCDLSASYNIGARYFIREILKSLPETVRLAVQAKVPELAKRSTCTWSSLNSLNAELQTLMAA